MKLLSAIPLVLLAMAAAPVKAIDYTENLYDTNTNGLVRGDRLTDFYQLQSFQLNHKGNVELIYHSFVLMHHFGTGFSNIIMMQVSSTTLTLSPQQKIEIHRTNLQPYYLTERIPLV